MQQIDLTPKNDYYAGFPYNKLIDPLASHLRDQICIHVPENSHVLDMGCGTGHQLFKMAPKIKTGIGIDLSDRMIAFANDQKVRKGFNHLSFDLASGSDLSRFGDKEFDLATTTLVLHEMDTDQRIPALKEMIRVSKKQVITDWSPTLNMFSSTFVHLVEMTVGVFHYHLFRSYMKNGGADGLLQDIGLNVIQEETALMGMIKIWICESGPYP